MTTSRKSPRPNAGALAAERCIVELQRGREIALMQASRQHVVALIDTLTAEQWQAIRQTGPCRLVVSGRRAALLGRSASTDAGVLALHDDSTLARVRELAGLATLRSPLPAAGDWQAGFCPAAAAALQLARQAHALPALLMYDAAACDVVPLGVDVSDAQHYVPDTSALIPMSRTRIPLSTAADVELAVFRERHGMAEHVAITVGHPDPSQPVVVRLHSSCFTGDILGSLRCDCGEQLSGAIGSMARAGGGVVLYVSQEGRGIGLASKLRAYQLQDEGLDTIEANRFLGFGADDRDYRAAVTMLRTLGIDTIRLVTNNPAKIEALRRAGIGVVDRLPSHATVNAHNARYLRTKRDRAGHLCCVESVM